MYNAYAGYFSGGGYNVLDMSLVNEYAYDAGLTSVAGGMGGCSYRAGGHVAGNGGTAGSGGTVSISSTATIYAFNGNKYTDGTSYKDGLNQTEIYAQNGIINTRYYITVARKYTYTFTITQEYQANGIATTSYVNPITSNSQGVGSGAGYIEVSNGTYTIE